jgi:exopolyphosphatase/guanosine-5'-triphosphate,3'-diphosphate pyrophosphatase
MCERSTSSGSQAPGRLSDGGPIAIIDIGSNSVRLVAYEGAARALTPIYNEKTMCGLGRGVASSGMLDAEAVDLALQTLRRFRNLCRIMDVQQPSVLATAAARDAGNGPAFLQAAEEACGAPVELLSGAREAHLSALGVVSGVHRPDGVVGDLGGGSLELAEVSGTAVKTGETFGLGVLTLHDLSRGSRKEARRIVRQALGSTPQLEALQHRTFYAVGGTWRALARLHMSSRDYPLHIVHGYRFDPVDIAKFLREIEQAKPDTLADMHGVSKGRRPLLSYGAIILQEIIRLGEPSVVEISAMGVREGYVFEHLDQASRKADPLLSAAQELNSLRSRSPEHGEELRSWTDAFMESAGIVEDDNDRRLRHAACLLADIGWRAHPEYRGEQSFNLIAHAAFVGLAHPERAYLALAVLYRYNGLTSDEGSARVRSLAGPRLAERARLLAGMLRVAYPISVATAGVLLRTRLLRRSDQLVLELPQDLGSLVGERLNRRTAQLARMLSLAAKVEFA